MAADLGLVAHAAQRLADELAPRRLGDALAQRGLADARRADEAQDRPLQLVCARLHAEIFDDPVLHLFQCIVILVQHRLRCGDVLLDLALLAPRQAEQHVEVIAHDGRLGTHRRHGLQLLELARRLSARFFAELQRRDLLGQLGDLVAVALVVAVPQLALNRLQLLVEVIFALRLLHLALDAALDLLLDVQDAELAFHQRIRHLEPLDRIELDQQRLLVGDLDLDVGHQRVGQLRRLDQLAQLLRGFRRQFLVELGVGFELLDRRAHQRLDLDALGHTLFQNLDRRLQIAVRLGQLDQPPARLALDQHAHGTVGQLQQLQHGRGDADLIQVLARRIVLRGVELRDEEDFLVGVHRRFQRRDRFVAADEQRHDHVRENDDIAQGKYGK